jgi:hypothetical protein
MELEEELEEEAGREEELKELEEAGREEELEEEAGKEELEKLEEEAGREEELGQAAAAILISPTFACAEPLGKVMP